MTLTLGQAAFLLQIRRYAERQQLAYDATEELRPDLLMLTEEQWTQEDVRDYVEFATQLMGVPQAGYWGENKQWRYFFHEYSCRLTHTVTEEPIHWDTPSIERFDKFWFIDHLRWALQQPGSDQALAIIRGKAAAYDGTLEEFSFDLLDQLVALEYLAANAEGTKYTLLDKTPE